MAQKKGAGGNPQNYDTHSGRYSATDYSDYKYPQYLIRQNGREGREYGIQLSAREYAVLRAEVIRKNAAQGETVKPVNFAFSAYYFTFIQRRETIGLLF